jgi:hypothetical protein
LFAVTGGGELVLPLPHAAITSVVAIMLSFSNCISAHSNMEVSFIQPP